MSKKPLSDFQAENSCAVSNVAREEIKKFVRKETMGSQNPQSMLEQNMLYTKSKQILFRKRISMLIS